jgi:pimeloyl-ACP methyl ester carboxylesterase
MGRGPLGFLELFQAWVAEVAALIAWARETGGGPVAVGGVSLGALTAQMVAAAARRWPKEARPDALLLIAPSGDMIDVAQSGSLSRALGIPAAMQRAGWSAGSLTRWAPLLQPQGEPGLDPAKIVMVLGEADDLVPYPGGLALAQSWGVPADNLFQRPQGHFSVSLGLEAAPQPLDRLAKLLKPN